MALLHHPVATVGVVGGANLLATKTAQRAMMGDTAAQEAFQALIEAHPDAAAAIQTVIRNAATTQVGRGELTESTPQHLRLKCLMVNHAPGRAAPAVKEAQL
jgi:hypothetical protein